MSSTRRSLVLAACSVVVLSAGPVAEAQPEVRVAAITATLRADEIEGVALVSGGPARVVFEMMATSVAPPVPPPVRVEATRRPARPQAFAAFGPTVAEYAARLPAPARFGSFLGRVVAYDAGGREVARSEATWSRPFEARVTVTPAAPVVDVGAAPAEAVFRIDVGGAPAIAGIAVQTSVHANAVLGFGELPYEAAQDVRIHGRSLPPFAVRLSRLSPTSFELRLTVPAATPPRTVWLDRVYLRSGAGHYAEQTLHGAPVVRVTSAAPRPASVDLLVSREGADLVVGFRYQGPIVGRARMLYGSPVPNVEARVRDARRLVRARCVPDENPMGDPPWGGETMTCRLRAATRGGHPLGREARLQIVAGPELVGEAPLSELLDPAG